MKDDPFRRFLGVDEMADPRTLLGLPPGERDRVRIETALRDRLDSVYRHPDGRSPQAERVRLRLRKAAAALLDKPLRGRAAGPDRAVAEPARGPFRHAPAPRPAAPRSPPLGALTEFDRKALAVLVGCGGWNGRSRARLVGLAGAYGVAPHGLIRIIRGLSDYARTGGPPLGVAEIGPAAEEIAAGDARRAAAEGSSPVGRVLERVSGNDWVPELKDESIGATIKLSLFFGLIAIFACVLIVRGLIGDRPAAAPVDGGPVAGAVGPAPTRDAPGADARNAVPLAWSRPLPTFLGNALPMEVTAAADTAPALVEEIDAVARRLSITEDPSEAVYRSWAVAIDAISTGWVLVDESTRRAIDRAVDNALLEATDAPSKGDRLLEAIVPPRGRLSAPADVCRGAWRAGTLARISVQPGVPTAVAEQARRVLAVTLPDRAAEGGDFASGATEWLNQAAVDLIDAATFDEDVFDFWEMWLKALGALGDPPGREHALLGAIGRLLETSTDLSRPGAAVHVLGRLLAEADFTSSPVTRDATLALFDRPDVLDDHDLWVLTSLLAQLEEPRWFDSDLVLPSDAGDAFRRRIRDAIANRWPATAQGGPAADTTARGLAIDPRLAAAWWRTVGLLEALPLPASDVAAMERVVLAARLNEAASLLRAQRRAEAEEIFGDVEATIAEIGLRSGSAGPFSPVLAGAGFSVPRRGKASGVDGEWAAAYVDARRNTTEKLNWLRALRSRAGTDLGPLDAEVFVAEVYKGSPREVRSVARSILVELFSDGPEVALEMLDQFPDAPRANREIADALRRFTGRLLPSSRSETWTAEARLALVRHALSLRRDAPNLIDDLATMVQETYVDRAGLVARPIGAGLTVRTPQAAAAYLADARRDRARSAIARRAVPDDLPGLARRRATRRRLAQGPVQMLVAEQIAMLDYHAYVAVARQPALETSVLALLNGSAVRRRDASRILAQAYEVERAMLRLWALRMALPVTEGGGA